MSAAPVKISGAIHWKDIRKQHEPLLGQKCFKLVRHMRRKLPVPPLFAIPNTEVSEILAEKKVPEELQKSIQENMGALEREAGLEFGAEKNPLVLAVRSGDPRSMYGSLLSVPGVGLNDRTYPGLIERFGPESESGVLWLYLDLIVDFALHVRGVKREGIQPLLNEMRDEDKSASELRDLIHKAQNMRTYYGVRFAFPQNVNEQLLQAIKAVAFSWNAAKAKCAAAALRFGPDVLLSVFVQQMAFSSLTPDSGFISLLTNPGPYGSFARKTSGRRIMFGLAQHPIGINELREEEPEIHTKVMEMVDNTVRKEKDPLNMEIVIERGEPRIVQIGKAALSPVVHVDAINELVAKDIISEPEATRKRAEVQLEKKIKMYKIKPNILLEKIAEGAEGAPGAMAGKLALTVEQALGFKSQGERVNLLSTEPQDENVYMLTLGHNIDGIMATYGVNRGSHIADFSQANGIPMVASLKGVKLLKNAIEIGEKRIKAGDFIVISGISGMVYRTNDPEPIIEDKTVISASYDVNYLEILRSFRNRYQGADYEKILAEHAQGAIDLKKLEENRESKEKIVGQQARIHCLHRLAYEIGKRLGKSETQVDLDVAVADGNLDRIEGLEDKEFFLLDEGEKCIIVTATEIYYPTTGYMTEGIEDVNPIITEAQSQGLKVDKFYGQRKLGHHTQSKVRVGLKFPKEELGAVMEFLKEYFQKK